jgi:hypothetical protein
MKFYRRFQIKTPYFYCVRCPDGSTGPDAEALGRAHVEATGHEVRVSASTELILRPGDWGACGCFAADDDKAVTP